MKKFKLFKMLAVLIVLITSINTSWGADFTAADIVASGGTTTGNIKVSSPVSATNKKLCSSQTAVNAVAISSNANQNWNTNYVEVQATSGSIASLSLKIRGNTDGTGAIVIVYWTGDASATYSTYTTSYNYINRAGSDCDASVSVSVPANTKTARIYRQIYVKNGSFSNASGYTIVAAGAALNIFGITATSSASCTTPTADFVSSAYGIGTTLDLRKLWSSNSDGAVTYTVKNANGTGATISDGYKFTATSAGTCTITASQASTATYCEKSIDATITVCSAVKRIYMACGDSWCSSSPKFYAHAYGGSANYDGQLMVTPCSATTYYVDIPSDETGVIFVRQDPSSTAIDLDGSAGKKWNQSVDITISTNNLFTCTGWNNENPKKGTFSGGTAATYTISFNGNGSTSGSTASHSGIACDGSQVLRANGFTRTGWTFTGWNTSAYGDGTAYADGATVEGVTANITLYAQWEKEIYLYSSISNWYDAEAWFGIYYWDNAASSNNGYLKMTAESCGTNIYKATLPGNGFTHLIFLRMNPDYDTPSTTTGKWNQTSNVAYPTTNEMFTISSGSDQSYSGTWGAPPIYKISFDANKGTGSMDDITHICSGADAENMPACEFTRTGWEFAGWNTNKYGSGSAYAVGETVENVTSNITLYAQWERTIYFYASNDDSGDGSHWYDDDETTQLHAWDSEGSNDLYITMTQANTCSDPEIFKATISAGGYDRLQFKRFVSGTPVNQTVDLSFVDDYNMYNLTHMQGGAGNQAYGKFASNYAAPTFTISYNGGTAAESGSKSAETKTCDVDFTLPSSAVFTRTGYTQTGWALTENGSQSHALGGSYTTNADQTFYPVWSANTISVTLAKGDHGAADQAMTIKYDAGSYTTFTAVTANTGYTCLGYYDGSTKVLNADGSFAGTGVDGYITSSKWTKASDCTLTAKWQAKTYTVTLDANTSNHGSTGSSVTATYAAVLPAFDAAVGTAGYQVEGYYTTASGEGTKIINANGTLVRNTTYATDEGTPKWKYDGTVTLYARYELMSACYTLTPSTSGSAPGSGDIISGTTDGGIMEVLDGSFAYSSNGLEFLSGSSSKVSVAMENNMKAGTVIMLEMVSFKDDDDRGLKVANSSGTVKETFNLSPQGTYVRTYTVVADDGLAGTNVFQLHRNNDIGLKSIRVMNCGSAATTYDITHTLSNVTTSSATSIIAGGNYTATFAASLGYHLPTSVTVTRGSSSTDITTNCSWNSSTGKLVIPGAQVTDDITISITGEADCSDPTSPTNGAIGSATAAVSWTAGGSEEAWEVYISEAGTDPEVDETPTATPTSASYTFTGLTAETTYYWWVRAKCSASDKSDWVAGTSFTTDCTAPSAPSMGANTKRLFVSPLIYMPEAL